jgi:hypothetical protein
MIELYYWPTPNGKKVTILLERPQVQDHPGEHWARRTVCASLPQA